MSRSRSKISPIRQALLTLMPEDIQQKRRNAARHRDEAKRLQHLQTRAEVVRLRARKGKSTTDIARLLGLTPARVDWYIAWALERTLATPEDKRVKVKLRPTRKPPMLHVYSPPSPPVVTTVARTGGPLDPVLDPRFQKRAFFLRTQAVPVDEIAQVLECSEETARKAIYTYSMFLNDSEINDVEISRRLQLEQIDQAIRALMPHTTGVGPDGENVPVILDATDRFIKLLDAKAKLLGLNAAQKVNIDIRLQEISKEGKYTYEELQEIYQEVEQEYADRGYLTK